MSSGVFQLFSQLGSQTADLLRKTAWHWELAGPLISTLLPTQFDIDPLVACTQFKERLALPNTTILDAVYYANSSTVTTLGTCSPSADIEVPLCRVQFIVNTSDSSAITAEAWLPTEWNGRFLALGNGGLGGCIDYSSLTYGTRQHFASVASNNGHDGNSGKDFLNPEVLNDFTSRSIHVETVVGKQLVEHHYGRPHRNSYYLGCSTGGRQGTYAALHYPDDFDGIVAGAPATNFHNLQGWTGMLTLHVGAPNPSESASFIPANLWDVVGEEVLRQCDELDGVKDRVITEPDACEFRPEALQCSTKRTKNCLTVPQVEALRKIYEPLYGKNGELLYPRFDPGAESAPYAKSLVFGGAPFSYLEDWMKYAIYNDTSYDYSKFNLDDLAFANTIDPGKISTFSGDMSAFKARGGKFLTYHGRRDDLIPSGNAKSLYNLVSRTLEMPVLDSFYRLFLIPGMDHCTGGVGPVNFGQFESAHKSNDPSQNILLALVEWVEHGVAPDTITGLSKDGKEQRVHCRYPQKSIWDGSKYICKE